jgi:15-cis-phytoene synthase
MQTASSALAPEPESPVASRAATASADLAACRVLLANGSRTFLVASYLLPRSVRDPACALYAFCRIADDAIDAAPPGGVEAALIGLRRRLDTVYGDDGPERCGDAVDRAFAAVVQRFAIPRTLPEALLEGFAWDVSGRRYETLADLQDYAARVAGTVGAMMALVMGTASASALARACDLGVAMQLSNIARDVGEDARAGRIYLPLEWLREAGLDVDAWLAAPRFEPCIGVAVARLLEQAELLYSRAEAGVAELPLGCRIGIDAARTLYREIGREVARRDCNSVDSRAVVTPRRKALLLAEAAVALRGHPHNDAAPLAATRYLVDAAVTAAHASPRRAVAPAPGRVVWLIDLFERLERQDQLGSARSAR